MDFLSLIQIEQISRDIRREDITFSHLADDLIDHVCCDVEFAMEQGLSFSDAYLLVKEKIGLHGLRKIQSDTLYVVDSKYRSMKITMKISGITGTIMLGFAAMFKIMHWPGAGILLTLGAFVMAFIFMPSSISVLYSESKSGKRLFFFISGFITGFCFILSALFKVQHWPGAGYLLVLSAFFFLVLIIQLLIMKLKENPESPKKAVYIIGAIGALIYISGLLFKFQHWPGAAILLMVGSCLIFLIAFPWYTWLTWKDHTYTHSIFIFLVPALIWIMVSGGLISVRVSDNYTAGFIRDYKRQEAINKYLLEKNHSRLQAIDSIHLKAATDLHEQCMSFYSQVEGMKVRMVELSPSTRKDSDPTNKGYVLNESIYQMSSGTPRQLFASGSADRLALEKEINEFRQFTSASAAGNGNIQKALEKLLLPEIYLPDTSRLYAANIGSSLNQLSLLQNAILISEAELLKMNKSESGANKLK